MGQKKTRMSQQVKMGEADLEETSADFARNS